MDTALEILNLAFRPLSDEGEEEVDLDKDDEDSDEDDDSEDDDDADEAASGGEEQ